MELRPFGHADIPELLSWFTSEAETVLWGGWATRFPLDTAQVNAMIAAAEADPPEQWTLAGTMGGETVAHGQVALDRRHGVARLMRIGIAPARRGQGLARPFLRTLIGRVFADPAGYERVELNVYTHNTAAVRAYRGLGFVMEGVRRSATRIGGARYDVAGYGMLRSEWRPEWRPNAVDAP